jgi:hypothetical protein
VDWLVVVLDGLRAILLVRRQNLLLLKHRLLNPLKRPFPLLGKAVAASPPRGRQLLNGVALPVLLLNKHKNVVLLRLLGRLELVLGHVPPMQHQRQPKVTNPTLLLKVLAKLALLKVLVLLLLLSLSINFLKSCVAFGLVITTFLSLMLTGITT